MTKLDTPVLFLIFNRLDTTKQVFGEIRKAKPKKLFVAADGPRNKEEKKKTDAVRKYVLDNIDWKCEVKTLFRKKNLGCGRAVSEAINWFFKNEEMGIILEDDCLPNQNFFLFCEELLKKYKNNKKIMHISGFNPVSKNKYSDSDYFFSKTSSIWGWATWKRAWEKYDFSLKAIDLILFNKINLDEKIKSNYLKCFDLVLSKKVDTWDYQWIYAILKENAFCITPTKNLVKNIGFGLDSTNNLGSGKRFKKIILEKINFPISHPKKVGVAEKFDNDYFLFFNRPFIIKLVDFFRYL